MKAFNGYSTNADPVAAGYEAAKKAGNAKTAKLVFAYTSCDYDTAKVIDGIRKYYDCPIIGNTSFTGVIVPDGYISGENGFVGIMTIAGSDVKATVACVKKTNQTQNAVKLGEQVANKALKDFDGTPSAMYMVASPTEEEFYLKGISNVVGRIPMFGGSCADNTISGNWKLYANDTITSEGVAVAFISGDAKMTNVFTGAYRETEDMGIITKVNGNRTLVEIDHQPALKVYAKWRKLKPKALFGGNLLSESITSPLGVKDRLGDLVAIRHPMNGNKDLSMNIGNQLTVGTCVVRMEASVDELIKSVEKTIKTLNKKAGTPVFYHLVHCGGRRAGIGDRIEEVYKATKKATNGVPFIMEFTFGEYGFEQDGRNTCGGLMLSFTAFSK